MNPKQLVEFGLRLRRRREAQNMTRSKLCQEAGITRTTLRYLENGSQHPAPTTLANLVRALDTTEELLTGYAPIAPDDPLLENLSDEDLEVAQAFHHAPTRVKQQVLGALRERGRRPQLTGAAGELWRRFEKLEPGQKQLLTSMVEEFEQRQVAPATATDAPAAAPHTAAAPRKAGHG